MPDHLPEWLIDDTADIGEARIFAVHTSAPRLIGELIPDRELGADEFREDMTGLTLAANGWTLCRIEWLDSPTGDLSTLCRSLTAALDRHDAIRGMTP